MQIFLEFNSSTNNKKILLNVNNIVSFQDENDETLVTTIDGNNFLIKENINKVEEILTFINKNMKK